MIRRYSALFILLIVGIIHINGQPDQGAITPKLDEPIESLREKINTPDELSINHQIPILIDIIEYYLNVNIDSCIHYQLRLGNIFQEEQMLDARASNMSNLGYTHYRKLEFSKALEFLYQSQDLIEKLDTSKVSELAMQYYGLEKPEVISRLKGQTNTLFAFVFGAVGNQKIADKYFEDGWKHFLQSGRESDIIRLTVNRAEKAYSNDSLERAKKWIWKAFKRSEKNNIQPDILCDGYNILGEVYLKQGILDSAKESIEKGLEMSRYNNNYLQLIVGYNIMARWHLTNGNIEEAINLIEQSISLQNNPDFEQDVFFDQLSNAYFILAECYEKKGEIEKSLELTREAQSIVNDKNQRHQSAITDFHNRVLDENLRIRDDAEKLEIQRNKRRTVAFSIGLILLAVIVMLLWKSSHQKQKANYLLQQEKHKLSEALSDLKSTQTQLIQSEKMASLGELTAGIAHEIQNPLNFVNNFSEVSTELLEEIQEDLEKGNYGELKELLSDLENNLSKIHHHGERASGIVKGMLDHSRATSDEKAPTDINQLCDEYLRLAYHGLRAKNKSFQANFRLEADPNLPEIMAVPQDMGRVLLNLINNAFQAVSSETLAKEDGDYQAEVIVFTRKLENGIEISVSDNGPGIPEEIKDKIFQPFFTTKPTGQGTGLGLSLAYDIVKSYGGKLTVHNNRGGSEFTIILPTI